MTKEGRLATHNRCLKLGTPSPYADEFADEPIEEPPQPEIKPKKKKKGVKKDDLSS